MRRRTIVLGTAAALLAAALSPLPAAASPGPGGEASRLLDRSPLLFVENRGQLDPAVRYLLPGRDKSVAFTAGGITVLLSPEDQEAGRWAARLDFVGADSAAPAAEDRAPAVMSWFSGGRESWKSGVPTWRRLVYRDLWPGIDLEYAGEVGMLKYRFLVRPGADPDAIRMAWRGVSSVAVDAEGRLRVSTPAGAFADETPAAWQEIDGRREPVRMAFALASPAGTASDARHPFGFSVGAYDRSRELVLDPGVVVTCGYLGSNGEARGVALDSAGNAYVTGFTFANQGGFPVSGGPDLTGNGNTDAFVAKIAPDGSLVWAGFIGGSGYDYGHAIAVDSVGAAYLAGATTSAEGTFPAYIGPDLTYNGGTDAFVAKVVPDGTTLSYCGYLGGAWNERANGIAVEPTSGEAYLTGTAFAFEPDFTTSGFPVTVGSFDTSYNGWATDAFVAKVTAYGSMLAWSGFLGGALNDYGNAIAVDAAGDAHVTGYTSSDTGFPVVGPLDPTHNGAYDAFVTKVKGDGTVILASGFLGGGDTDYGNAIALDGAGNVYVAGDTYFSASTPFPATVGPDLTHNGGWDAFVAKVRSDFSGLEFAGYIGGAASDQAYGVAVDAGGNAYVAGPTSSSEATFPVTFAPDNTYNGNTDAFVARVDAGGAALDWCGYVGGVAGDYAYGVAATAAGDVVVVGSAASSEATFPVRGGPDLTRSLAGSDPFVARLTSGNSAPVLGALGDKNVLEGDLLEFTVPGSDPDGDTLTFSATPLPDGATLDPATGEFAWTPALDQAGVYAGIVFSVSDGDLSDSVQITITVEDLNAPPVLTPIGSKSVDEGQTLEFTVSATDGDGEPLTYSAANLPGSAAFDPGTQAFTWTPGFADAGVRTGVRFEVTDGKAIDFEEITITVGNVNRPPALNAVGDRTVDEGGTLTIVLGANDPDGGPLTFSVANAPAGASFDAGTGTFSWTPAPGQAGTYPGVRFEVSDGTDADFEEITITVGDVDFPPVVDPVFPQSVTEGATLSFVVTASDPDNDPLLLSADALPEGSSFDGATGTFTWRPRLDQWGTYEALFRATQQTADPLFDTRNVWITVDDPTAPVVAENFADSTAAGDKDWTRVSGTWAGNGKTFTATAPQASSLTRSVLLNPVSFPLGAGVIRARIVLAADGASPANASILFAYRGAGSHRWVKVTRTRLSIGQTGTFGGVSTGTKKSVRISLLMGKPYDFRVEIATNGWVRVYQLPGPRLLTSYRFVADGSGSVVPGGVGLGAAKAKAVFDNVIVEDDAALP